MTDAYILVRVPERSVGEARKALHETISGADIVFYEDGRQARYYGDDVTEHSERSWYLELESILHGHIASAKANRHNHMTRDIKPVGECPACDKYHAVIGIGDSE